MLKNLFANMGPVTKNLLIINVAMLIISGIAESQGIDLGEMLGMHYFKSSSFRPFQIVSHMFMHANIMHLVGNMFGLVFFGSQLERVWDSKRFLIFYLVTGFGALFLYILVNHFHIVQLSSGMSSEVLDLIFNSDVNALNAMINRGEIPMTQVENIQSLLGIANVPMVGASGAVFGVITAFAMLFPNTTIQLLFPPIPIKAKWFALGYIGIELYLGFQNNPGDNVAHFAHLGGALIGFIMVKIWNKKSNNFY
jgi:membrane associated rhomboid family serine protease